MKIKSWVKRFFRGWVPAEPKMANYWSRNKLGITLFLSLSIIVASIITFELWNVGAGIQTIPAALPTPPPESESEPEEPESALTPTSPPSSPTPTPTPTPTAPTPTPTPTSLPPELTTLESNYYPGVSIGDYVTYGNFISTIANPAGFGYEWISSLGDWFRNLGDMDWQRVEVIGVSGKEVTLRYTEQLKNGSFTEHSGCVHVIENIEYAGAVNGTCQFQEYYFKTMIAANLTEGDCIHEEPHPMPFCNIAKTEIRTYLGVNRWVNIIYQDDPDDPHQGIEVYDLFSGMLLEYEEIMPNNERLSYSIIETNIFSTSTSSPSSSLQENTAQNIPTDTLYATSDSAMIAISMVAEVIFRKKRRGG